MTFAEGACETRSRSEEEAMQGHRRRQGTQRSPATPSAQGVAAGRHRFLCRSSSAMRIDISSSSLRKLDAVALATNVTVFMKRGTKCRPSLLSFFTTARQHDSTTARQHDSTTARQHDSTIPRQHGIHRAGLLTVMSVEQEAVRSPSPTSAVTVYSPT